jgi:MFS family permease
MFDGAEMGVFSLVSRPAIKDLLGPEHEGQIALWIGVITATFLVGAATGGVLFGWLGDCIGRVRAMTLSILTYAVFTSLCGVVQHPGQLGLFRFIAALGMGGEWSLGVALVMEVWPNRSRAFMAGLIGAAANVGYMLVGVIGLMLAAVIAQLETLLHTMGLPQWLVLRLVANEGWRIMMIMGVVPALLTFFIRLCVPESERWEKERDKGSTRHWATADLLGVFLGALGPGLMVYIYATPHSWTVRLGATVFGLVIAIIGYTFPVVRYLQRQQAAGALVGEQGLGPTIRRMLLAACLSGVALLGTWGGTQQAPAWADKLTEAQRAAGVVVNAREHTLIWLSVGAIVGTIAAAFMGQWMGRRNAYCLLCALSFGSVLLLFQMNRQYGPALLASAFVSGVCTASFYGWLPLYLPELFGTRIRATAQGFGFNFGRILAAVGTFQLGGLVAYFDQGIWIGSWHLAGGYPSACVTLSLVYPVGLVIIWLAPETHGRPLPD